MSGTIAGLGEFGLIARIAARLRRPAEGVLLGIGDDTAVLDMGGPRLTLATVDMQVEGRHFLRERTPPELLGRRVAAVNLSDIAAMGGTPRWALVSLALPASLPVTWVDAFYEGLDALLGAHGAAVVGGNLAGNDRIVADLTLLGDVERGALLTRGGARLGDLICVTGTLGRSAAGRAALDADPTAEDAAAIRAHLAPEPRVREGQVLAAAGGVTAMIDLSDGLAGDLAHICTRSDMGARIETALLPVAADTHRIALRLGLDPLRLALSGGEDFELLFTAPAARVERLRAAVFAATGSAVTVIGEVRPAEEGRRLIGAPDRETPPGGWDHFQRERQGEAR